MRLALIGCGRMGKAVEALAPERDHQVVAWVDSASQTEGLGMTAMLAAGAEVAIDFTAADAVADNVRAATGVGLDVVVGTTGWYDRLADVEGIVTASGRGLIYAPNFSLGVQLFARLAREAARLAELAGGYDVHLVEAHHRHKADHPSGTAVRLAEALLTELSSKDRWSTALPDGSLDPSVLNVSVIRAGEEPGTHIVGLDGPDDRIELRHRARDRSGFARGALAAAEWIRGRPGLYTMDDMMADRFGPEGRMMTVENGRFRGLGVALVTPFREDGSLDLKAFARHVAFQVRGGVDFLVPCGTTGESATMEDGEQRAVIQAAVAAAAGRVPVVAGAGTNDTEHAARLARNARAAGADGVLTVSPYYNKPSPEGLFRHYEAVADAAEIPVIVYNVPGRTGGNIDPATLFRIAEIDNVIGVKEASGDLEQIMTVIQGRPDGFLVLSGDDALTLPIVAAGGDGVISVVSNEAPDLMSALVSSVLAEDMEEARRAHYRLYPLMKANFLETNPVPVKTALQMMDRMEARFRLPLAPMTEANADALEDALVAAGLLE